MPPREWRLRIMDILDAIKAIQELTTQIDFETFIHDSKTVDAVLWNIMIIGEAAAHVPDQLTSIHPEIPWQDMRDSCLFWR